ncbi:hypothetical protein D3C79_924660 [compost metagenome]
MPKARNIPVDSTKMMTTTRHIDRIGARLKVGMPKCSGVTTCTHGAASRPERSTMPMEPARM